MRDLLIDRLGVAAALADAINVLLTLLVSVAVALLLFALALSALRRLTMRTKGKTDDIVLERIDAPMRWIVVAVALSFAQRGLDLPGWSRDLWQQVAGFILPGLIGWMAIALVGALRDVTEARYDISVADNLRARRKRTRVSILSRIGMFAIVFVTICMMLLSIPGVRSVGVTLMASAGLAGLAVGAAAQPALKNLIAGIQLAFTEPIRIDDVVIMDNEWGRIEEIRLTYVVIRIWDDRRLIVPVSKFLEESFQNWTRASANLMGAVILYLDPAADIGRLRAKTEELVAANPRWDRRFWNLQVTDMKDGEAIEVRVLLTASDASVAFDLRCDVREALLSFIAADMPEAIARRRQLPVHLDDLRRS